MIETMLVVPDQHAHPDHDNSRADLLSRLTIDLNPDVVINMGDAADMHSISSYDKGSRSFVGRTYKKDIDAHLEFQSRWWDPVKARKRKLPHRVFLEGNHEHRIERVLDMHHELEGSIGFKDLDLDRYYDEIIRYNGSNPGIYNIGGVNFAHYFVAGISGRPTSGDSPARLMINKFGDTSIQAHNHLFDHATRKNVFGRRFHAMTVGCYQDYINEWAGQSGNYWTAGVLVLRGVENGDFGHQWIPLEHLKKEYS